jgi:hypothetical protein
MKKIFTFLILLPFLCFLGQISAQNNALEFDGSNDYVELGTPSSITSLGQGSFTIEAWIKTETTDTRQCIVGNWDYSSHSMVLELHSTGNLRLFVDETGYNSTKEVDDGQWHHVVGVRDITNNKIIMYVDGIEIFNQTVSTGSFNITNTTRIGRNYNDSYALNFDGQIDEVRLWNDVRTESEIRQNMYRELPNPSSETNLVAYYKLNETSGTTAEDYKGNIDGTLTNMVGNEWQTSPAMFGPKNCLEFDGSNDRVESTNAPAVNVNSTLTIEAWVRPDEIKESVFAAHGNTYLSIGMNSSGEVVSRTYDAGNGGGQINNSGYILETNSWCHIAAVFHNGESTNYVNGLKVGETSACTNSSAADGRKYYVGWGYIYNETYFDGQIDEVRIWSTARTASEIRENMMRTLNGNESGLAAYYTFDNTSGTTLQDFSENGNDGTLTNMDNSDWVSSSAFNTWLNTSSNNPASSSNWSRGSVPGTSDNVGIYNLGGSNPVISSNFDCNHFYLESGASISMYDGVSFLNQGNFYCNGTFNIEKDLTFNRWFLVSAPITSAASSIFEGHFLQTWDETTATWSDIPNLDYALTPGHGFGFYGQITGKPPGETFTFSGTPNDGNISASITYTSVDDSTRDGANLLGNPYPSSIDWNQVSGYGAVYYWNGDEYLAYPETGGYGTGSQYVPPMQGFFIVVPDGDPNSFTFTNAMRTHSGASNYYKSDKALTNGVLIATTSGDKEDLLLIRENAEASDEFDFARDALKLKAGIAGKSEIWSISEDVELSIDIRNKLQTIPLGYSNSQSGTYQISVKETDGITQAELEDTKLNQFHNLVNGAYTFDWNTTDSEERFILHLKATGTNNLDAQAAQVYATNHRVYVRLSELDSYSEIAIYDLSGRMILAKPLAKANLQSFELNESFGAYLVQLKGESGTQSFKIVL